MRGFGQIADLCRIARPHVGVITNVGPVHLELVGSLEGVQRAKGELVAALPAGRDGRRAGGVPGRARRHRGRASPAGPRCGREDGPHRRRRRQLQLHRRAPGRQRRHRAGRARRPRPAARPSGVDVEFSPWRGEELPLPGGGLLINDAYNANPVSMRAALAHLAAIAGERRRVAILGDMAELGSAAPAYHEEIGARLHGAASTSCWPSASSPAATSTPRRSGHALGRRRRGRGRRGRRARPAGRRRARQGLARARPRAGRGSARGGERLSRVLLAGVIALLISILAGPKFIEFLRRKELGQHIREEGPRAPRRPSRARRRWAAC